MRKIFALCSLFLVLFSAKAQYLIVGKDSISLNTFKTDYKYGLENNGIEKTLTSAEDFLLLQQLAQEKKVDTTAYFREKLGEKETELRKENFFPKSVVDPVLTQFVSDNKTEKEVLMFVVQKTADDKTDYKKVYDDVKSGKMSMQDAIKKYTKGNGIPFYTKAGTLDNTLYDEIKNLQNQSYTKLVNNSSYAAFAKVTGSRPSLGYMIFGTVSYPNDDKAEETRAKIEEALKAGQKFEAVTKTFGSTDQEKNNGGIVMGSPTLPEAVYNELKGQKPGYHTKPLLIDGKYYIFNIYQLEPYVLTDKNRGFFLREMQNSMYSERLEDRMIQYIETQPGFKEFPLIKNLGKSFAAFDAYAKDSDVLLQYNGFTTTVGDIKTVVNPHKDEAAKLSPAEWQEAMESFKNQNVMRMYSQDFPNQKSVKTELDQTRKMLYSDYIFSKYLTDEIKNHPEWMPQYYKQNQQKFKWEKRAHGRVAIIADPSLVNSIKKEIKDPKNWEALKTKYYGKLNADNQIIVHFEEGNMTADADIFTKYKVPFAKGIHATKMEKREIVMSIDQILEPTVMTETEASELLKDAVTQEKLTQIIAEQRAKTKIVAQPELIKALEQNFKK